MLRHENRRMSGFTLVEMAIVLGVAGLLFGGLWRLLSNGNQQMRDQATAGQQEQLIGAISTYLQSPEGQAYLQAINGPVAPAKNLPLPPAGSPAGSTGVGGCVAVFVSNPGLCNILPPGTSVNTTNPYGQTYTIQVLKDGTAAGTAPLSYSFMILTSGGDTIPDTSGGRISAMIGGDGGFVYNTAIAACGATPNFACGSYGSWSTQPVATYGFAASTVGHIASRTYYSPYQNTGSDWLARIAMPNDANFGYNTMKTSFFLGATNGPNGAAIVPAANNFYFGSDQSPAAGTASTGAMYVQGGTINMSDPTVTTLGGTINMQGGTIALGNNSVITGTGAPAEGGGGSIQLIGNMNNVLINPLMNLTSDCTINNPATPNCTPVLQVSGGDIYINGGIIKSQTFTYAGSDARLKTDVKALADPLGDIMQLKPVSFAYKANGKESIGVIAQDLEKVYPQLVVKGQDGMRSVAYDGLIAPLIGSVQELKRENDSLRAELREQAMRQEKMEQDIEKLRRP